MPTFHVTGNQTGNTALDSGATPYTTPEIIDVSGITRMAPTFETGDGVTINLAAHSEWIGGFRAYPTDPVKITGTGTFDNIGSGTYGTGVLNAFGTSVDGTAIIGVNVIGTGSIGVYEDHVSSPGKLEFMKGVGAGQTVSVSGHQSWDNEFGIEQIDAPSTYHASTKLGYGEIILEGLKATSYALKNDLLSIFNGRSVVDTMKLTTESIGGYGPQNFGVSQVGGSVVVHADGSAYNGTLLAVHA